MKLKEDIKNRLDYVRLTSEQMVKTKNLDNLIMKIVKSFIFKKCFHTT